MRPTRGVLVCRKLLKASRVNAVPSVIQQRLNKNSSRLEMPLHCQKHTVEGYWHIPIRQKQVGVSVSSVRSI